jgi:hypothetical protein
VGTQAVLNILLGERYKVSTEEGIRYVLGHYGKTPAPVDQNVLDKMTNLPEAQGFLHWIQPQPTIKELRKEMGRPGISDDELLLRLLFAEEHVEETIAAGPIKRDFPRGDRPVVALIHELTKHYDYQCASIEKGEFLLQLSKNHG